MAFWFITLTISCVVLLFTIIWATIVRRAGYIYVMAFWFRFLQDARFPLYALSGFVVGFQGTWLDGVASGFVVAAIDGTLGWWLSARILKPRLVSPSRAHFISSTIPLAIIFPIVVGSLFGGIGALISLLWK